MDVALLICLLIWKAIQIKLGLRSGAASSVFSAKDESIQNREKALQARLPTYTLSMPLRLLPADVEKYLEALAGSDSDPRVSNPPTNADSIYYNKAHLLLFLSAVSEPAFLIMLSQPNCPIQPLGAVNVSNRFELLDYISTDWLTDGWPTDQSSTPPHKINVEVRFLPTARVVKRGIEIDIAVSINTQSTTKNPPRTCFTQTFTLLEFVRWPKHIAASVAARGTDPTQTSSITKSCTAIRIGHDDPSRWAALCLDYNPIHHLSLAAKAAGFRNRIAHGNHVAARAIAVCDIDGEKATSENTERRMFGSHGKAVIEKMCVAFRRPVVVGTELDVVKLVEDRRGDDERIEVRDKKNGKVCVEIVVGR